MTPPVEQLIKANPTLAENFIKSQPNGRIADPNEIVEAVLWLCSDAASFVTGHAMVIDGGYTAQ